MIYLLLILSAVAKAICDKINFLPALFPLSGNWWLAKGAYSWDKRTFLIKYPFSFLADGWHFFDAVRVMSLSVVATIGLGLPFYFAILVYAGHGLIFELVYKIKKVL